MRRSSLCSILPLLALPAACTPPAAPNEPGTPRPSPATTTSKACSDAAGLVEEASKLAKEGRFLRATLRLDQAEELCKSRGPEVIALHAQALAEIGRCERVRGLAPAAGPSLKKAEALCAERTRGVGDAAAEEKSRSLAREGQKTLQRGDLAKAEQLAAQALAAAATDEALLLDARANAMKGDQKRARRGFDRAFTALERRGEASLAFIPRDANTVTRADGARLTYANGQLWIFRTDIPDRVTTMLWPDIALIEANRNGKFIISDNKSVALFDIESASVLDRVTEDTPALFTIQAGKRALLSDRNTRWKDAKLVDLTDPARLKVIETYKSVGKISDVAGDGSLFLLRIDDGSFNGIRLIDAQTGKVLDDFKMTWTAALSSDHKLIALCEFKNYSSDRNSADTKLVLYDRDKKRPRWAKKDACWGSSAPLHFGAEDRVIHSWDQTVNSAKVLDVKNGAELKDDPEPPSEESPKAPPTTAREAPPASWLSAGLREKATECVRALSGDGALLSVGCKVGGEVFESRTGKRLFKGEKHITLPPRGSVVATEDALCDVRSGTCVSLSKYCKTGSAMFSTDAARVLCTSEDGEGIREITLGEPLAIQSSRVFPGSKGWFPAFMGPRSAGALRISGAAIDLLFLDFDKGTTTTAGQPGGMLFWPDGRFTLDTTGGELAVLDSTTRKKFSLPDHAGATAAALVSPDGKILGLKDSQQTWRFWSMPERALLGRADVLDGKSPPQNEQALLSTGMKPGAQILTTGYMAGALGDRNSSQRDLSQGFWLMKVSDPSRLIEARWTDKGGYLLETRRGSRVAGETRVALLGEGTALLACRFGDAVAPLEVCREAFVVEDLAQNVFGPVSR